jgi:hypothetical protein
MQTEDRLSMNGADEAKDTLLMMTGMAMIVFGAGLVLANPIVRRLIGQAGQGGLGLVQAAIPDLERYLKLRSM